MKHLLIVLVLIIAVASQEHKYVCPLKDDYIYTISAGNQMIDFEHRSINHEISVKIVQNDIIIAECPLNKTCEKNNILLDDRKPYMIIVCDTSILNDDFQQRFLFNIHPKFDFQKSNLIQLNLPIMNNASDIAWIDMNLDKPTLCIYGLLGSVVMFSSRTDQRVIFDISNNRHLVSINTNKTVKLIYVKSDVMFFDMIYDDDITVTILHAVPISMLLSITIIIVTCVCLKKH